MEFNEKHKSNAMAQAGGPPARQGPGGFDGVLDAGPRRIAELSQADEETLGASRITDWFSPAFFDTEFWYMWSTTFAFQPWHSAVEFRRYLHRFMLEFSRIETLAGVKRTIYNQYDSLVLPCRGGSKPRASAWSRTAR